FVYSRYSKYFIFRLLLFQTVRYLFSHRHLDSAKVHVAFTKFLTLYFRNIVRTFWAFSSGWYILFISQMFRQDHSFCLYISITSKKHDKDSPYIALPYRTLLTSKEAPGGSKAGILAYRVRQIIHYSKFGLKYRLNY